MDSFVIENTQFNISSSFGISIYPKDGKDSAGQLLNVLIQQCIKQRNMGKMVLSFLEKK